jgi:hypothetical protein
MDAGSSIESMSLMKSCGTQCY